MVSIVINPVSGGATASVARRRAELAAAQLAALGEAGEVTLTTRRGHGRELAEAAVRRGDRLVIAWGGDGTVNELATALARTQTTLGIVAAGSGNGLARELKLPSSPADAIALACRTSPMPMDAGELGGLPFFSIAGIGFDAHVAAAFDTGGGRRGFVNYARIVARELFRYQCADYRINGREIGRAHV